MTIQSFFNLGLAFSVNGDQLAVAGLSQFPADDRARIQDGIRRHKAEIMAEVKRMQDRLRELVTMADNSKGLDAATVARISAEGSGIIQHLCLDVVIELFAGTGDPF